MVKLVDIYSGNTRESMADLKAQGYSGVWFKLGQGGWADVPRYQPTWWDEAGAVGLLRGGYWLCDSRYHSSYHMDEIRKWDIKNKFIGELGFWVDIEKPQKTMTEAAYYATPYAGAANLVDFIYLLELDGFKPGAYSGPGAYELVTRGAPKSTHNYIARLPLWSAQYNNFITEPDLYGSFTTWEFWQKSEGPDINVYNGTDEEFVAKYGGVVPPPPQENQMDVKADIKVNIRADHSTSSADVGDLNVGASAVVSELWETGVTKGTDYEQWARIPTGWVAVWYRGSGVGGKLCTLTGTLTPPPPPAGLPVLHISADGYAPVDMLPLV